MISWAFYPKSDKPTPLAVKVVEQFGAVEAAITSANHMLDSDAVLAHVSPGLTELGFRVEVSKKSADKVRVPVLLGRQGRDEKSFDADAYHETAGFVVEVEAGRAVTNYQFLKDLFEACMMHEVAYLAIAVRQTYRGRNNFEVVCTFFDTLFASARLKLPLSGVLIIGY